MTLPGTIKDLSEAMRVYHPFHSIAREEIADLVAARFANASDIPPSSFATPNSSPFLAFSPDSESVPDEGPAQHILLHGPAGSGKRNLAQALQTCLKGTLDVLLAENDKPPKAEHGIVVWVTREGIVPKGLPPRTPRVKVRSLSSSEKQQLLGVLVESVSLSYGLNPSEFLQDDILKMILTGGFAEAGVLGATQRLQKLCRRRARTLLEGQSVQIDAAWAASVLGPEAVPFDRLSKRLSPGCVYAPMVSPLGGAMALIEVFAHPGKGRLVVTGAGPQAEIAGLVARSRCLALAQPLRIPLDTLTVMDWHIHVTGPEGPKDGASLGWPVLVAMASHLSGIALEPRCAFTGEIGLSGEIRSVGGIEEKFLACERQSIKRLWLPEQNLPDLAQLEPKALGMCHPSPVSTDLAALHQLNLISTRKS